VPETAAPGELEREAVERLTRAAALELLSDRDRELLAMRYGADMKAAEIAQLLDSTTNAVEVAVHRALRRLRGVMQKTATDGPSPKRKAGRVR
jgi:RNA polymerase sigma-70 factor (ECF subfamily)